LPETYTRHALRAHLQELTLVSFRKTAKTIDWKSSLQNEPFKTLPAYACLLWVGLRP
jgi:hypothetical protein